MKVYFRMTPDLLDNYGVQIMDIESRWAWVCLHAIAVENNGRVEKNTSYLSMKCRLNEDVVKKAISEMLKNHLLDETDDFYVIHDWNKTQRITDNPTLWKRQWRQRQKETQAKDNQE